MWAEVVEPASAEGGIDAHGFELRAGEGVDVVGFGGVDEWGVGFAKFVDEDVGVANVAVVDGAPCSGDDVVAFPWVARVRACGFAPWAGYVPPKDSDGADEFVVERVPDGGGTRGLAGKPSSGELPAEMDFPLRGYAIGVVIRVGMLGERRSSQTIIEGALG